MSEPVVRPATPADREAVVATVVAAFDRDPAFRFFFDDDAFGEQAAAFVGALFDRRVARDAVWVTADRDAVAMWEPPHGSGSGLDDDGDDALPAPVHARLTTWDEAVHDLLPTGPHWYLGILATHPRRAGEGLGRRVVAPGLAAAHATGRGAWLETATAGNVAMYVRRGWQVTGTTEVAGVTATVLRFVAAPGPATTLD